LLSSTCPTPNTLDPCRSITAPTDTLRTIGGSPPEFTFSFYIEEKGGASVTKSGNTIIVYCGSSIGITESGLITYFSYDYSTPGGTQIIIFDSTKFSSSDPQCPIISFTFVETTSPTQVLSESALSITVPTDTVRLISKTPSEMKFTFTVAT
jgi:hypothetical protein